MRRACLLLVAIGVLACAGTASAASGGPVGPRVINGADAPAGAWPGIAYLQYDLSSLPTGIAVDSAGDVYTANYAGATVSKVPASSPQSTVDAWALPGGSPLAIAIDTRGTGSVTDDVVYVASNNATVTAFDSAGAEIWTASTDLGPVAIAIDSSGNVYTANSASDNVTKITPSGVATAFADTDARPSAIAIDTRGTGSVTDDVVYTVNRVANTITKFDSSGNRLWSGGTPTGSRPTDAEPSAVAIDASGNVYVANAEENTVTKFDSSGNRLWSGGTPTGSRPTGASPSAIAIDAKGAGTTDDVIYTANYTAGSVTALESDGDPIGSVTVGWGPSAIAVDAVGNVYTADQTGSTVSKITRAGGRFVNWATIYGPVSSCTGSVIAPDVILTAAHCTVDSFGLPAVSGLARPGVIARSDTDTERYWDLSELATHPDYDPTTLQNDVALVVLDRSTAAPAMPLIAPWQDGLLVGGAPVNMAGWGKMAAGGISPTATLQEATVPLISNADCERGFTTPGLAEIFDPASMLCAYDQPAGIGVCHGDSGGPLAMTIAGTRTAIGVASWVQVPCASGPSVYSRTSAFRSWILNDLTPASVLVRDHLEAQNAAARNLELRSTGPDVTLTWGVTPANWTTTGFRVTINGSVETVTGPTAARTVSVPSGGTVTATVLPEVTLGTATAATLTAKPTPTRAPVVSATTPAGPHAGKRLTVSASSDDPWGGALAYQWLIDGAAIPGATTATYRPLARQAGRRLSVRITATNAVGTGTNTVTAGLVRQAPQVATGPVAVTGTARVGDRLQVRLPAVGGFPQPTATYRWFRDGRRVPGASGASYRVRPADAGARITGRVTWTNAAGTAIRMLRPTTIAP